MQIFTKDYWVDSFKEMKSIKRLAFAALICALTIVIDGFIRIPTGIVEIKFIFLPVALGCAVYGPVAAAIIAVVVDTLSFLLFSTYAYFPGYMLTEIVVALFFCLFLYKKKITIWRLFFAKICTNFLAHLLLNSLWDSILMSKGYLYYFWERLIKNAFLLPIEVLALALLFGAIIPHFSKWGLLPSHSQEELERLSFRSGGLAVFGLTTLIGSAVCLYFGVTSSFIVGTIFSLSITSSMLFFTLSGLLLIGSISLLILSRKKPKEKNRSRIINRL